MIRASRLATVSVAAALTVARAIPASAAVPDDVAGGWSAELLSTTDLTGITVSPDVDAAVGDAPLGGLSGLDHIDGNRFLALSDDRGEHGPARAYTLDLPMDGHGGIDASQMKVSDAFRLTDADGTDYAPGAVDPESIRTLPGGDILWNSEGKADDARPPAITVARADGRALRGFAVPDHHKPDGAGARGVRDNQAYESLTLIDDATRAVTITEGPLAQDAPEPGPGSTGSPNRLTIWDVASGAPVAEHVYPMDAVPARADGRGVTEILAAGDGAFITLERSYIEGQGTVAKLYVVDLRGAADVLSSGALTGAESPVVKRELLDLSPNGENVDNVESLAWGPELADGRRGLLITSDDNFNAEQRSLVHTVAVTVPQG